MNKLIIELFKNLISQMQAEYLNAQVENNNKEITMHSFRLSSTKKALTAIKNLNFEIISGSDVKGIPSIGPGTIKRIQEILDTGTLSELKNKYDDKKQNKINSIQELEQVIGIGNSIAKNLVIEHNILSIKDLKKAIKSKKIHVNDKILLGLKYYGIVQGNIPRKEVIDTEKYLVKKAHTIDKNLELMICGSYRRGKSTSGDIDVLLYHSDVLTPDQITNPEKYDLDNYFKVFIDILTQNNFLIDHMTDKKYEKKYMGFCQYKSYPVRRIDIRVIPYKSLPAAMLYYTGPYELNILMRKEAKKRKMILNEYGLYKIDSDDNKKAVKIKSEADIFEILGMEYLEPEKREALNSGKLKFDKK